MITPAVTFPTTLAPIVQCGLVPVFVDCELGTYNIDPEQLEAAISPRTRALFIPHTLGNPFALDIVTELAASMSCTSSRTAATRSARPSTGSGSARSASSRRSASTPPTR